MSDGKSNTFFLSRRLPWLQASLLGALAVGLLAAIIFLGFTLSRQIQINEAAWSAGHYDLVLLNQQISFGLGAVSTLSALVVVFTCVTVYRLHQGHGQADDDLEQRVQQRTALLEQKIAERARAETLLAQEHNLLRAIIDSIPDGIYVKDTEARFTLTNLSHANFMGTTLDGIKGKTDLDFMPAEMAQQYYADDLAVMQSGQPLIRHEEPVRDRHGNLKWAATTKVPLRDGDGKIIGLIGISYDITGRKQIENDLARERSLLRTVVDILPDAIFAHDLEGRILLDNIANRRFVGRHTPEEMVGKTVYDYFAHDLAAKLDAQNRAVIETGEPILNDEQVNPDSNGSLRSVLVTKVPLRDSHGNITGVVGIARDITERKQMDETLSKERVLLQTVIDNLPDPIFVKDRDGRNILVNQADVRFAGARSTRDLIGKTVFDFFSPDQAAEFHEVEQQIYRDGIAQINHEEEHVDGGGKPRWFLTTKVPLRDSQNNVTGLLGIARDITERKQVEDALRSSEARLRALISAIPDLIFRISKDGIYLDFHADNVADLAVPPDKIIGANMRDSALPKTVVDLSLAAIRRALETDQIQSIEYTLEMPDGVRHYEARIVKASADEVVAIIRNITERKRAERALAEERNLLRTLIDNLPEYVYVKDTQSRWILRNATDIHAVFGLDSPEELIGKTDFDFFPAELAQRYYDEEQAIIRSGQPILNRETRVVLASGEENWLAYTKVPLRDTEGKIIGIVGTTRDITERKHMEEALDRERNLLRTVMNSLPDFVYVKDTECRFILLNETCLRDRDLDSPDELIGKSDFDIHPSELAAQYYADDQEVMCSGKVLVNHEETNINAAGETRRFLTTKLPLRDSQGNVIGLVGVSRNVTERRQMEDALASERNLLRTVIDTLPDLIYVRNLEGRMLLVNEACLRFVGAASYDAMIGKTDFDFYEAEKATRYFSEEQAMMRTGQPIVNQEEFVVEAHTGNSMWVSATKVPLRDAEGSIIGMVGVSRDITARKQAEQALAEERNLLRTVIDTIPDYIYVKDRQGRFVLRNISGLALLEAASPDDVIGKTDFDLYPEELARDFYQEEQTIIQTGHAILNQEVFVTEPNGIQHWLLYTKVPLRDSQGDTIGIVGVTRDINERKQAEEQLRKLSSAVEQSSSAIVITDTEGMVEYLNPRFAEMTGFTDEDALGQKPNLWQSGATATEVYQTLWERIRAGGEWRGELLNRRHDGELFWCLTTISSIRNQDGEITHFIAVQEDITERKQAEEALKRAHDQLEIERAQLQAILDSMGEGVIYDEPLQTRYINQALTRLTGYSVEEWQGYLHPPSDEMMMARDFQALRQAIAGRIGHKGIWRGEIRLKRKDSVEFDAGLTCTEVTGTNGEAIGAVTIIRDISVEKALQEQKSRFVANASHELRTPITNLKTRLYLLRKQPEKLETHLQIIEEVTARMQRLVEDMLDVSRFERGQIPLRQQEVVVQELVSGVIVMQRAEAERKQIALHCELPPEPLVILADPERMTQVITNLVVNAINYTPEGGSVYVDAVADGGYATINVRDTGVGIAPDHLHQVFQPFFRASQGVSEGTGLGLTIVKDIIELHSGNIEVDSMPGEGSRFSVKLALHAQSPNPSR